MKCIHVSPICVNFRPMKKQYLHPSSSYPEVIDVTARRGCSRDDVKGLRASGRRKRVGLLVTTMKFVTVTTVLLIQFISANAISGDPHALSFDRLYTLGIASYEEERWFQCVSFMSRAIEEHAYYSDVVYGCRVRCKKESSSKSPEEFTSEHGAELINLQVFQNMIKNSECVKRCKLKNLGEGPRAMNIFRSIMQAFSELKPYDYLQICAFQTNDMKQAVAAAYTYFLANPNHTDMLNNLQYYRSMPNIHTEDFINLEEKDFQTHYIEGSYAYTQDDWKTVVTEMEAALEAYFIAEERCRLECEGHLDTGQAEDFTDVLSTISGLYVEVIRCKLGCEGKMGVIHSKPVPDYVADHYHYLQYAYFKLKNYDQAANAAESYLLFNPHDDIMLNNKLYYLKRGYGESFFVPRPDALEYSKRRTMMMEVLSMAEEGAPEYESYDVFVKKNYISMGDIRGNPSNFEQHTVQSTGNPFIQHFARIGIKVFADNKALHGPNRFAADGLMRPEQCQELIYLTQAKYDHLENKPTLQEINIPLTVELLKKERISDLSLRIMLRASEVGRFFLQQYLNLTKIYLHDTRLLCRDFTDPSAGDKDCYIQEDGSCVKWFPINPKSDYVAVIHLNKVMTGGEIYLANENLDGQGIMLSPKCGRMVGFPANAPHGVLPFPSGVRCALVFSYSKNRSNDEKAHSHAFRYLAKLEDMKQEEHLERLRNRKAVLQEINNAGISVTKTDENLEGEERVVADDLLTSEQCDILRGLAKAGGRGGDGYRTGSVSPHTEFEQFIGLTVDRAAKNGSLIGDGYGDKRYNTQMSSVSPHTKHEMFHGLTVLRAAQLANLDAVDESSVELYLSMSEKSRDFVEKYFNLESPLYFDFTHLVCRKAIEIDKVRDDLSHPVHADNCILQDDETCVRQFPAYTERDYSALLYLNADFEGGDFFFAHANKSEQVALKPKCGRLVGFNAAAYHGVKAVTEGERCALALWFTLDPDFKEIAHIQAKKMLRDRKDDPNYSLPSSSPLFTMPGIPEKQQHSSLPGHPLEDKLYFGPEDQELIGGESLLDDDNGKEDNEIQQSFEKESDDDESKQSQFDNNNDDDNNDGDKDNNGDEDNDGDESQQKQSKDAELHVTGDLENYVNEGGGGHHLKESTSTSHDESSHTGSHEEASKDHEPGENESADDGYDSDVDGDYDNWSHRSEL